MSDTYSGMRHDSLCAYFHPDSRPSRETAVVWRRGYALERWRWATLRERAWQFARELEAREIAKGERVLLWGGNSGEWVAAFLGCMFRGAVVVPMDVVAAPEFAQRVAREASVKLVVTARDAAAIERVPRLVLEDLPRTLSRHSVAPYVSPAPQRSDPLQIVFTSGTTAEPRGVVLTHGNLLANLQPLEAEIAKYRRYERFFHPLKILNLLPLSHIFGQMLGVFIPQILGSTTIYLDSLRPSEAAETIRREGVSVLVTVPRLMETLRDKIERDLEAAGKLEKFRREFDAAEGEHFLKRWWRFREIHSRLGWRFWALISGGAALPADAEKFWGRLGYAVVQGYGLTETTSLISVNHPFRLGQGSIGKVLHGMEVKLDENGEILVRGENVAAGYWQGGKFQAALGDGGWFRTGDLGSRDAAGNLYFRGRQKNVIVTSEGMNIYPEDLMAELRKDARVQDCVVIGLENDGHAEPAAVLILREASSSNLSTPQTSAAEIVQRANESLASYQRIRRWFVWPDRDFPRTPTQKPQLAHIRAWVAAQRTPSAGLPSSTLLSGLLARITHREPGGIDSHADLSADLNLSSVDRVALMSAIEDTYQVDLNESKFTAATTIADLGKLLTERPARSAEFVYPRWAQRWPARCLRAVLYYGLAWPTTMLLAAPRVLGRENLRRVTGPLLVVSNHVTYLDPAYILAALPPRLRGQLAVAMDGERLAAMRCPPAGTGPFASLLERARYFLVVLIFNVFPLPRRSGFRESFAYAGELAGRGKSILIFPEGELTRDGEVAAFRPGIGLLAAGLGITVVPMRIDGLFALREKRQRIARPGTVRVAIGAPMQFSPGVSAEEITAELHRRVASLS